ncbi:hypothetical protein [Ruicaihuangia caeni]|uniref:Uncharacterized protein n=1 Tax=Ruicaihuangia caeni TaxID=3042517 RepID=A0AAW6TD14_9MICO|nr:hypothetical protein [Klugiella sp. YN-L-19]MDI2099708.1 hypothetical protein [Klugiella sp. YN-L-19]
MGRHVAYRSPWWSSARHRGPGSIERALVRGRQSFVLGTAAAMLLFVFFYSTPSLPERVGA